MYTSHVFSLHISHMDQILTTIFFFILGKFYPRAKILRENTADISTESINILGILALGSNFWKNLFSLPRIFETQMSPKTWMITVYFEIRYFGTIRCSVLPKFYPRAKNSRSISPKDSNNNKFSKKL